MKLRKLKKLERGQREDTETVLISHKVIMGIQIGLVK